MRRARQWVGAGIVVALSGEQTRIAAGSSAAIGLYQVQVLTVETGTTRFVLTNPDG